jgi:predicted dehydrogenase
MKKIKFAIVGCGRIAYRHIEAIQANNNAELVALCDLNLERARERNQAAKVKVYRDYNRMLINEDIDVVNIMTPSGMHAEHAIDVINKYQKHVVIEKPMALRVTDAEAMIQTARANNVHLFIVHQNRYNKAIQKVKSAIVEGEFGSMVLATVRLRWSRGQAYYDQDPWRGTWALDGGALTNQAVHHIDLLRWLMGDIRSVSAIAATRLVDVEVEDTACAWVRFENGALGLIEATTATRPLNNDLEASISLLGEKGTAIVEGAAVNKLNTWTFTEIDLNNYSEAPPNVYGYGHNTIIDNVVETIASGGQPLVGGTDALRSIQLLNAIYASIEQGGVEVFWANAPVSQRLGVFDEKSSSIANLYRSDIVLKGVE